MLAAPVPPRLPLPPNVTPQAIFLKTYGLHTAPSVAVCRACLW